MRTPFSKGTSNPDAATKIRAAREAPGRASVGRNPSSAGSCPLAAFVEDGRAMERILFVLTGPTAVGKTEWALRWAEAHDAEIVSCDSLLFYRGMDIGTAKPTPAERARVPHHLIDFREVAEPADVTDYVTRARAAVEDIHVRGRRVLVAGGSGFYLKSFFAPVADAIDVAPAVRAAVAERWQRQGLPALVDELRRLNLAGLGALDVHNPRRVVRALERCVASGRTLAELAEAFARQRAPFDDWEVRLTRLDRSKAEIEIRIEGRVRAMLAAGLVDEVRRLLAAGLKQNASAARAIGYRETVAMIEGRLPAAELAPLISRHTRALVKKQLTWFRTQLPPHPVRAVEGLTLEALFAPIPGPAERTGGRT
jgi:tRNA dimethylallyltransferase